jgi:hypothetical protein
MVVQAGSIAEASLHQITIRVDWFAPKNRAREAA